MITKTIKENQVSQLADNFSKAKASFLVNCIGLDVGQMTELRKNLKQNKADIKVIRNTLARLALEGHSELKETYNSHLDGPNAFVLAYDDIAGVAKIIDELSSDSESFEIKCGVLEGSALSQSEIKILSSLPPLDVLRAQFVGVLSAPLTKFLGTLQAVPGGFARLLNAHKEKQGN